MGKEEKGDSEQVRTLQRREKRGGRDRREGRRGEKKKEERRGVVRKAVRADGESHWREEESRE